MIGFVVYPYLKRWTWISHLWLGAVDGLAPMGAWVAITGSCPGSRGCSARPSPPGSPASTSSTACSTWRSTAREGLNSVTTRFGVEGASWARGSFTSPTVVLLVVTGLGLPVGVLYWIGVGVVAALLAYEHSLVRPGDLRRLDAAFFTVNGVISVAFFVFVLAEVLW